MSGQCMCALVLNLSHTVSFQAVCRRSGQFPECTEAEYRSEGVVTVCY